MVCVWNVVFISESQRKQNTLMLFNYIKLKIGFTIGRYFFDFKGKHLLLKYLNNPYQYNNINSGKKFNVKYFDVNYEGILSNFIDWGVYFQHGFENGLIKIFINETKKRRIDFFIDIGANSGSISLPLAKKVNVICFEPMKYNFEKLTNNFKINKNLKKYQLYKFGASNKDELKYIKYSDQDPNIGTASIIRKYKKDNKKEKIKLKILDKIIKFKKKNLLIKIDVEGYEDKVLDGIKDLIKNNNVFVYVETKNTKLVKNLTTNYNVLYPKFWYSKYFFLKKKFGDDLIFKNYD